MNTYEIKGFSDNGIVEPHFVNGYGLTADDLLQEEQATAARLGNIGQAAGHGIAEGLVVTPNEAIATGVNVSAGLGVAQAGNAIYLKGDIQLNLALVKEFHENQTTPSQPASDATNQPSAVNFGPCVNTPNPTPNPSSDGFTIKLKEGLYVLVAQSDVCQDNSQSQRYNSSPRYRDGVTFKLIMLHESNKPEEKETDAQFRNRMAYGFFGNTAQATRWERSISFKPRELKSAPPDPSLFGTVWTKSELPLAVIYWQGSTVKWVENWSVRRRIVQPPFFDVQPRQVQVTLRHRVRHAERDQFLEGRFRLLEVPALAAALQEARDAVVVPPLPRRFDRRHLYGRVRAALHAERQLVLADVHDRQ